MGQLIRMISEDGGVLCIAADTTDAVGEAERIHETSAVVTAALGRLLTGASIMGTLLKGERDSVTLRLDGGGPAGLIVAAADSRGNVRGYAENTVVELPLNEAGKLDVAGAVGREGTLTVSRDLGMREPYIGQVPIVSGEIAEDITNYYAVSEQTPTVCALGVLVNPDLTVCAAGGYLVQLLPGADDGCIGRLEENIRRLPSVSSMIRDGMTPEAIARSALDGFAPQVLGVEEVGYCCNCSRARMERALIALGKEELEKLARELPEVEMDCHFCRRKERFSQEDVRGLIRM